MRNHTLYAVLTVLALCVSSVGAQTTVDFNDLVTNHTYHIDDFFKSCGVTLKLTDYADPTSGYENVWVRGGGYALGSGNDLFTGGCMLHFGFGNLSSISLLIGDYYGQSKIEVNGDIRTVSGLNNLDGLTIGGAHASFVGYAVTGGTRGALTLTGPINSFSIGGIELAIDDVTAVPEPSSALPLLAALTAMAGIYKRRT